MNSLSKCKGDASIFLALYCFISRALWRSTSRRRISLIRLGKYGRSSLTARRLNYSLISDENKGDMTYYDRLGTYNVRFVLLVVLSRVNYCAQALTWDTWTKPRYLSPALCASRGWVCVDRELLQCQSCDEYISARLPCGTGTLPTVVEASAKHFYNSLVSKHAATCAWRSTFTSGFVLIAIWRLSSRLQNRKSCRLSTM